MPPLKLPRHARYDYSPITERKDYSWPGGKRLAFCITTNIESFAFGNGTFVGISWSQIVQSAPLTNGPPTDHAEFPIGRIQ